MSKLLDLSSINLFPNAETDQNPDIVVGIRQQFMNNIMSDIYKGLYPTYFNDHIHVLKNNKVDLSLQWDVQKPPSFTFAASLEAETDFLEHCQSTVDDELLNTPQMADSLSEKLIQELLAAAKPIAITLSVPQVEIKAFKTDNPDINRKDKFGISVSCYLSIEDNVLSIVPFSARIDSPKALEEMIKELVAPSYPNTEYGTVEDIILLIINKMLLPYIVKSCQNVIPKFKIPELNFEGIKTSGYFVSFEDGCMVIGTKIDKMLCNSSNTSSGEKISLPKKNYFIRVNSHALQVVSENFLPLIKSKLQNGRLSMEYAGVDFDINYGIDLKAPSVSLSQNSICIKMEHLNGAFAVRACWWLIKIGFHLGVQSISPLELYLKTIIRDNQLYLKFDSCSKIQLSFINYENVRFTFLLELAQKVIQYFFPGIMKEIFNLIFDHYSIFTLPEFKLESMGNAIKFALKDTEVYVEGSNLFVAGDIATKVTQKPKNRLVVGDRLLKKEYLLSSDTLHIMEYQDDGNVVITRIVDNYILWASDKCVKIGEMGELKMLDNGDLAAFDKNGNRYWHSETENKGKGCYAVLENDGVLVLYTADGLPYWNSESRPELS